MNFTFSSAECVYKVVPVAIVVSKRSVHLVHLEVTGGDIFTISHGYNDLQCQNGPQEPGYLTVHDSPWTSRGQDI